MVGARRYIHSAAVMASTCRNAPRSTPKVPQSPLRAHRNAPSTADAPAPGHPAESNRHRRCTGAHPRQQLHVPPHPHGSTTTAEGARKCTLDRRYLCTRPLNGAQPPPRANRNAPPTAISTPSTQPSNGNPPRRRTKPHPQQQIDPHQATKQNPMSPRVHNSAPSTGFVPTPAAVPPSNCHRRCSIVRTQQQLHDPTHPHGSTTATEGARKCTLGRR